MTEPEDTCRIYSDNEGQPIRVHGGEPMDEEDHSALRQVVAAAKRRMLQEKADEEAAIRLDERSKVAEHAWIVPKVPHIQYAPVGPRVRGLWVYREQGATRPEATRDYAAQLLAAADAAEAAQPEAVQACRGCETPLSACRAEGGRCCDACAHRYAIPEPPGGDG